MTNKIISAFIFALASALLLPSTNAADAKSLYQTCVACHGEQGQGNSAVKAPILAGQYAWYTSRQLNHFISGVRGAHQDDVQGQQMRAMVSQLNSDTDVLMLAKYLEGLPAQKSPEKISGDLMNGSRYYQAKCGACHSGKAEGNKSFNAPKLAGQSASYLKTQMSNFISGVRGSHSDDKLGKQMAMMAKIVTDKELNDIIYYITQQPVVNK